jgi:hypothetical protein
MTARVRLRHVGRVAALVGTALAVPASPLAFYLWVLHPPQGVHSGDVIGLDLGFLAAGLAGLAAVLGLLLVVLGVLASRPVVGPPGILGISTAILLLSLGRIAAPLVPWVPVLLGSALARAIGAAGWGLALAAVLEARAERTTRPPGTIARFFGRPWLGALVAFGVAMVAARAVSGGASSRHDRKAITKACLEAQDLSRCRNVDVVAVDRSGRMAASTVFGEGNYVVVELWELTPPRRKWTQTVSRAVGNPAGDRQLAFSPDGSRLAFSGAEAALLDTATGRVLRRISACGHAIVRAPVAFSADGRSMAIGGSCVRIESVDDGTPEKEFAPTRGGSTPAPPGAPYARDLEFSRDGNALWINWAGDLQRWDVGKGARVLELPTGDTRAFALSRDGHRVIEYRLYSPILRLWDADDGAPLATVKWNLGDQTFSYPTGPVALLGGEHALVACQDGFRLVALSTGKNDSALLGESLTRTCVAASDDGAAVVMVGSQGSGPPSPTTIVASANAVIDSARH